MIKPLFNNIIVEPLINDTKTKSGILLNSSLKGDTIEAKIIDLGNSKDKESASELSVNKKVIVLKNAGKEVQYEDKTYMIIDKKDILAVIE